MWYARRRSPRLVMLLTLSALIGFGPSTARAQNAAADSVGPSTSRGFVSVGGGFAQASNRVAGATGSKTGPVFAVLLGATKGEFRRFSLDVEYEPFRVQNPQRDERFSSVNVLVSWYLGPIGLGLGYQYRMWTGSDVWVSSDGGPAVQITLAPMGIRGARWTVSPDVFVRYSGGDEIGTSSVGIRMLVGRVGR